MIRYEIEVEETLNLFEEIPETLQDELVQIIAQSETVRIERIISEGHASPAGFWYDQAEHEWVLLLQGEARLSFENNESLHLLPGDHRLIPAHHKHRVDWTSDVGKTIWLAVFFTSS